jgi:hypothetical protein
VPKILARQSIAPVLYPEMLPLMIPFSSSSSNNSPNNSRTLVLAAASALRPAGVA